MSNLRNTIRRSRTPTGGGIRTTVFQVVRADHDTSRQIEISDEFQAIVAKLGGTYIVPPPYPVARLYQIVEQSNMLGQCIEAMVTNIVLSGWEPEPIMRGGVINKNEEMELVSFIEHPNADEDLKSVAEKIIRERESCGFSFLEVIRSMDGLPSVLRHAKALTTRMCPKDDEEVLVTRTLRRGRRLITMQEYKKFRKYVQVVGGEVRWFKEFGDPRRMNCETGIFEGRNGYTSGLDATEIIHFRCPSNDDYGVPRWIAQLPSIIGSREAEEVNMRYFQDNTVPPMMLLVGNGRLTRQSFQSLTQHLNSGTGKDRQNKVLLLEAMGEGDSLDGRGSPIELKVEKLSDTRQSDGLFSEYDKANMTKVRSAFRLPPVVVGLSQDVNFATASTSAFVAESQVFAPERDRLDAVFNNLIVNGDRGLGLTTCKLQSRVPSITSPEMLIKTLTALNVIGAITPRKAQEIANKVLQIEIPPYPKQGQDGWEEWMDKPIQLSMRSSGASTESSDGQPSTHLEQGEKDDGVKKTEGDGDVMPSQPKHGEE